MKKLIERLAREFAEDKFRQLPPIEQEWNRLHSLCIIRALEELGAFKQFDKDKLSALAWVHDIGKIEGEESHPEKGLKIIDKLFELDDVDRDCILNHGSNFKPHTSAGKLFRNADGLSLFYPEIIHLIFHAEALEGKTFVEVKEGIKKRYEKYAKAYASDKLASALLEKKYHALSLE